jgi:hypothetical protein
MKGHTAVHSSHVTKLLAAKMIGRGTKIPSISNSKYGDAMKKDQREELARKSAIENKHFKNI